MNAFVPHRPTAVLIVLLLAAVFAQADLNELAFGPRLAGRISDYHAQSPANAETLRVVYFYAADATFPPECFDRVRRIVLDVQDFYLSEMKRHGFTDSRLPLEMEDGKIKIHTVQGQRPTAAYSYEYSEGKKVREEIREALAGQLSFDEDFVLIICGLCTKRPDGSFLFNSPYYGGPGANIRRGHCFVADCELQDPLLLTDKDRTVVYEEHYGRYTTTAAHFNTKYLGGIAHELGHGQGLPHCGQTETQRRQLGVSLMGSGNHTYRQEVWDPNSKGSFLTYASCLQLAAHPLFTQSDRGRELKAQLSVTELTFAADGQALRIEGTVQADPEALALIVYSDPEKEDSDTEKWTDYDALTWVGEVCDGRFSVTAAEHRHSFYKLRLAFLHINGDISKVKFLYGADEAGRPDADRLNTEWTRRKTEPAN